MPFFPDRSEAQETPGSILFFKYLSEKEDPQHQKLLSLSGLVQSSFGPTFCHSVSITVLI